MKALVGLPTLSRSDLLMRNKGFLEAIKPPDMAYIIDNGSQRIDICVPIERPGRNLGVAASWNRLLNIAFLHGDFDILVILQDDIIWDLEKLAAAKRLVEEHRDIDLFLSFMLFSVQVHRKENLSTIGYYDERFHPAWCEDDDYALTMIKRGRIYHRFRDLDPLPGSIAGGTEKEIPWGEQRKKLVEKWGMEFGVNDPSAPYFVTNRNLCL
jgi:hypothetical protein